MNEFIQGLLHTFKSKPYAISADELEEWTGDDADVAVEDILRAFRRDRRYVTLKGDSQLHFVPVATLTRSFIAWTMRAVLGRRSSYSSAEFLWLVNSLRRSGKWEEIPTSLDRLAPRIGVRILATGEAAFPIASVLRDLSDSKLRIACEVLPEVLASATRESVSELIKSALSRFGGRIAYVVTEREGLAGKPPRTLADLALELDVTRARVQQVEARYWKRIHLPAYRDQVRLLIRALVEALKEANGSRLIPLGSLRDAEIHFLAKCLSIPYAKWTEAKVMILGGDEALIARLGNLARSSPIGIELDTVANEIVLAEIFEGTLAFSEDDVSSIVRYVSDFRVSHLDRGREVYLALRSIGHPAHYREVAQAHNQMFPNRVMSENSVHAKLSDQKNGIVWLGLRGTFALEEWGYERPKKRMFDTVTIIVEEQYQHTKRPVPLNTIMAEMGKHRQLFKPNSVSIAAFCNPALEHVGRDSFIPKGSDHGRVNLSDEKLDEILKGFEESVSANA